MISERCAKRPTGLPAPLIMVVIGAVALACTSREAAAQAGTAVSVPESMQCYREAASRHDFSANCSEGVVPVRHITFGWRNWDPAIVDQVAEALLAEIAVSDMRTSIDLVYLIASMGTSVEGQPGRPGTVELLEEAYELAPDKITVLGATRLQSDSVGVAGFLGRVVREEANETDSEEQWFSITLLSNLGPEGVRELRHLRAEGAVSDPRAKAKLEDRLSRTE